MNWLGLVLVVFVLGYVAYRMLPAKGVRSIRTEELKQMLLSKHPLVQYIDVREPGEFRNGHIQGFRNIPLGQLKRRLGELDRDKPVVVMCHSGMRSAQAARLLVKQGFSDVRNVSGGMLAWNSRRGG
ncbi:rhodanese-like domain-containing protein [Alicyclobacillus acidiphilus]|uniref:rhodanese-like domain-containing protein n=1 Tax=Alicyclobacillus acidiphilus TaxID=182455 RepID=UPI00082E094D|nr:rhodanese-like domain-containing protein [Alicyclobacillus acidiphilus]